MAGKVKEHFNNNRTTYIIGVMLGALNIINPSSSAQNALTDIQRTEVKTIVREQIVALETDMRYLVKSVDELKEMVRDDKNRR